MGALGELLSEETTSCWVFGEAAADKNVAYLIMLSVNFGDEASFDQSEEIVVEIREALCWIVVKKDSFDLLLGKREPST